MGKASLQKKPSRLHPRPVKAHIRDFLTIGVTILPVYLQVPLFFTQAQIKHSLKNFLPGAAIDYQEETCDFLVLDFQYWWRWQWVIYFVPFGKIDRSWLLSLSSYWGWFSNLQSAFILKYLDGCIWFGIVCLCKTGAGISPLSYGLCMQFCELTIGQWMS